ncbi:MAG: protocatechuate 3,4-dioxygenase [Hyphomonadaceae bacterium]|jgi:protocatechuate 3,4-dioxygenase beta subunit|nr:protocatechuate 3,4-dioxygenase [Hyphomonadaceae bacterium]
MAEFKFLHRRAFLGAVPGLMASGAAAQGFNPNARAGDATGLTFIGTPQMTLGPFYPIVRPHDQDFDLTRIGRNGPRAFGEVIDLAGQVTRADGLTPVSGATVELWQACASGAYNHGADPNPAPKDPRFQGFARLRTDGQGRFRIRTVMPGPYGNRAPHIHFDVIGRQRRLITQMMFPDHPLNATDNVLLQVRTDELRARTIATRGDPAAAGDPPLYLYKVVLGGE